MTGVKTAVLSDDVTLLQQNLCFLANSGALNAICCCLMCDVVEVRGEALCF